MNIPNILTTIRFLLIPLFVYYFFSPMANGMKYAALIFLLAGATDVLDGYIARKYKLITRLGIVLDPLADKLMVITVLICISVRFPIPIWIISVVIAKEAALILGAIALYNGHDVVVPANRFGKMATVSFYIAALAITFDIPYSDVLLNTFIVLTILALLTYLINFIKIKKESRVKLIKK